MKTFDELRAELEKENPVITYQINEKTYTYSEEERQKLLDSWAVSSGNLQKTEYRELRQIAYPPVVEQLDMMFHNFNLWKSVIQEIKDTYPKP